MKKTRAYRQWLKEAKEAEKRANIARWLPEGHPLLDRLDSMDSQYWDRLQELRAWAARWPDILPEVTAALQVGRTWHECATEFDMDAWYIADMWLHEQPGNVTRLKKWRAKLPYCESEKRKASALRSWAARRERQTAQTALTAFVTS